MALEIPPPINKRCQIRLSHWYRCGKLGTHWVAIPGCGCEDQDPDVCIADNELKTWECEGPHVYEEMIVGEPPN